MARSPRTASPLHDQVTASAIIARLDGFEGYLDAVATDARKAADATLTLTARLTAENTQGELQKIWARMEQSDASHREDLRNSYNRLSEAQAVKMAELERDRNEWKARFVAVEDWKKHMEGANGLLAWAAKHAPWLLSAASAIITAYEVTRAHK